MIGPGAQLGSYRVLSPLGEGGMGVVYVAEHVALERRGALKVLRPEFTANQDTVARFFNEARAVNKIGHEHIVDVTDFGTAPSGEAFYVMELLAGESLAARLKRGPLPIPRALHVAAQVADALAASHRVGIVHRDLKPDNVFLITRGEDPEYVKLLDFGIAKLTGQLSGSQQKTRSGAVIGTPYYMSPEQCLGKSNVDHRADVYALGVVLFEMVTGRVPFAAEGWGEILVMHATAPFPSLRAARPEAPEALEELVGKAVAKDREARWPTMEALRDALRAMLGRPSLVRSGVAVGPSASDALAPTHASTPLPASRPGTPSPSAPAVAAASNPALAATTPHPSAGLAPAVGPSTASRSLIAGQQASLSDPPRRRRGPLAFVGGLGAVVVAGGLAYLLYAMNTGTTAPKSPTTRSAGAKARPAAVPPSPSAQSAPASGPPQPAPAEAKAAAVPTADTPQPAAGSTAARADAGAASGSADAGASAEANDTAPSKTSPTSAAKATAVARPGAARAGRPVRPAKGPSSSPTRPAAKATDPSGTSPAPGAPVPAKPPGQKPAWNKDDVLDPG